VASELLGDITGYQFCLLRLMLPFRGLSVCLFVHCALRQKISTQFLRTIAPCFPQIAIFTVRLFNLQLPNTASLWSWAFSALTDAVRAMPSQILLLVLLYT